MARFHVAIDGPAGSGKSTISKKIAENLGLIHIDTGSMYRAITYIALKKGINLNDEAAYEFVGQVNIEYKDDKIYADGEDVTERIRKNDVTENVSKVSSYPTVRKHLVKLQKEVSKDKSVIMDGRDIGTVVLPDANLKIFLTAHIKERAKRRLKELQEKGQDIDLYTMIRDIEARDLKDSTRKESPLIIPRDAVIIDTTDYSIEDTVDVITKLIMKEDTYHGRK